MSTSGRCVQENVGLRASITPLPTSDQLEKSCENQLLFVLRKRVDGTLFEALGERGRIKYCGAVLEREHARFSLKSLLDGTAGPGINHDDSATGTSDGSGGRRSRLKFLTLQKCGSIFVRFYQSGRTRRSRRREYPRGSPRAAQEKGRNMNSEHAVR